MIIKLLSTVWAGPATPLLWMFLATLLASQVAAVTAEDPATSVSIATTPWPATDALGRELPVPGDVPGPRADRFVGIFYFLWHDQPDGKRPQGDGPYDVAKIFAADPDAMQHPNSPLWGPLGMFHYWGEPLFGYYHSADPWVLRRHCRLLVDAGIDTLIFDTTNAVTYPAIYTALCDTFSEIRKAGGQTPRIVFMVKTQARQTADQIFHDLYQKGRYRDLWFIWHGKPLMLCDPPEASPEVKAFFTLRGAHWPFDMSNVPMGWNWESTYPQPYGFVEDPKVPEQVNVAVAQNLLIRGQGATNMSDGNARGRSFHDGAENPQPGDVNRGLNFAEQWKRALQLDPPFVMVTGWNEWIAGRFAAPGKPIMFVDQFTEEYSRDIEPMKGGHGDNYYYQLVDNVRRYKGIAPLPPASAPLTIDIHAGGFDAWKNVSPDFADAPGDIRPRDFAGVSGLHYDDHSGRNQIVASKVARDATNIYFYVRGKSALTPSTGPNWMWLFIRTPGAAKANWEGYDYIINRTIDPDGSTWLERSLGGWKWEKVARLQMRVAGNELEIAAPRKALSLADGPLTLDFKWADNLQHPGDVMDFYTSGDVSPAGRFRYRYTAP